jgi:hypothetical protein
MAAVKDLDICLAETEILVYSKDYGRDLSSIEKLLKKHQMLEADIKAHHDRVQDMNAKVDTLLETDVVYADHLDTRRRKVNDRYHAVQQASGDR